MKVFVTVGTQLPFDRLIRAMDRWAAGRDAEVFAQTGGGDYRPQNIAAQVFIDAAEAAARLRGADLVVAHAGMGSILTRLETGRPMIVLPRRAALGEHRNDHQSATARRLAHLPGLRVVEDEDELLAALSGAEPRGTIPGVEAVASPALISAIRDFVSA